MDEIIEEQLVTSQEEVLEDIRQGKYMTFQVGVDVFGIELKYVNEIIQIQPITTIPEVEHFIKGLINLRGKIIPVIDVAERFGKESFEYTDRTCVIVIGVKNIEVGLIIEHIAEVVSIEEENILPPPTVGHSSIQDKFVHGIGKIGEEVKLLLDPEKLLSDDALDFIDKQEAEEDE